MKRVKRIILTVGLGFLTVLFTSGTYKSVGSDKEKNYESLVRSISSKTDSERIRKGVYYLSKDPLPRRVLNWSLPGHSLSSLEEADQWIMERLENNGYKPETDETKVQAFGRDFSKPLAHQYSKPEEGAPWYTARNIIAERRGRNIPVISSSS